MKKFMTMLFLLAPSIGLAASQMTTTEIIDLYANSTSVSSTKSHANYYSADGSYKSTNLTTGVASEGTWSVQGPDMICIKSSSVDGCWNMSRSTTKVFFSANGKTSSRDLDEFMRGDKTEQFLEVSKMMKALGK
jgi:hypothetical protein